MTSHRVLVSVEQEIHADGQELEFSSASGDYQTLMVFVATLEMVLRS